MSLQHILKNSSVSGKEPLASQLANGELSINYHADGPFLCCKDTAGNVRRVAGVWVATTAPSTPFPGELWLDTSITPSQLKVYKDTTDGWTLAGSVNSASTTSEGIVRLATNGDTQTGTNATSAVTPASLQSKISDSTTTVSATTIASSTAVKSVGDLASAALPKSGGTITGTLEIGNTGQIRFEGSSNDAYETTLAVEDPTATRTITLPDRSGTVITTGDTGTVTNTMLAGSIADSKLSAISTADKVSLSALNIDGATDIGGALSDADLFVVDDGANGTNRKTPATRISDYTFGKVNGAVTIANNGTSSLGTGVIVNSNVSNTAAIAGTKVSPDFGIQNITTTGKLLLGTSSARSGFINDATISAAIQLEGAGGSYNDNNRSFSLTYNVADNYGPNIILAKSRSGSLGGVTVVQSGDEVGALYFCGADGTDLPAAASILGYVDGTPGANDMPGRLVFSTTADGSATPTERMRIDSSGRVGIGTSSPDSALTIAESSYDSSLTLVSKSEPARYGAQIKNFTTNGQSSLLFLVNNNNSGYTERLRIDSFGRVGIGTSSPGATVDVSSTTGARIRSSFTNNSGGRDAGFEIYGDISGTFDVRSSLIYAGHSGVTSLTGALDLAINTNNSERLRVDSSGNLGLGTSNPNAKFVLGSSGGYAAGSAADNCQLVVQTANGTSKNGLRIVTNNYGSASSAYLDLVNFGSKDLNIQSGFRIAGGVDSGAGNSNPYLSFSTVSLGSDSTTATVALSERMRIDSTGAVICTSDVRAASFSWESGNTALDGNGTNIATWSSALGWNIQVIAGGTNGVQLNSGGTAWGSISDERRKTDLKEIENGFEKVAALRAVTGRYLTDEENESRSFLIAQDVQSVLPEAVSADDSEEQILSLRYSEVIPLLVAALKESKERIETLEAKVAALEAA